MSQKTRKVLSPVLWLLGLIAVTVLVFAIADFDGPRRHKEPTGGETFEATGALYSLEGVDWPMEKADHVRDMTEQETAAFRYFIREADYEEMSAFSDQVEMPVVRIDGVYWYIYRQGLFRKEGGESGWRKTIEGVNFSSGEDWRELDFRPLVNWYEREK